MAAWSGSATCCQAPRAAWRVLADDLEPGGLAELGVLGAAVGRPERAVGEVGDREVRDGVAARARRAGPRRRSGPRSGRRARRASAAAAARRTARAPACRARGTARWGCGPAALAAMRDPSCAQRSNRRVGNGHEHWSRGARSSYRGAAAPLRSGRECRPLLDARARPATVPGDRASRRWVEQLHRRPSAPRARRRQAPRRPAARRAARAAPPPRAARLALGPGARRRRAAVRRRRDDEDPGPDRRLPRGSAASPPGPTSS